MAVHVAVGVICDGNGCVLIAKRGKHQHLADLWEFPGGKVEDNESVSEALVRELNEELDLIVTAYKPFLTINHDYGDVAVLLDIWLVSEFNGEASGREGQVIKWAKISDLQQFDFPEANLEIVEALQRIN